jgi:hypothetical protein
MGYLNNSTITVDAILTKKGRELLARNRNEFKITQFALSDDEVDYDLWNPAHPNGSDYYGVVIENMPVTEAVPDETLNLKYKLITLPRNTPVIPVIKVNVERLTFSGEGAKIVEPTTINFVGANSTLGYTFILGDNTVADIIDVTPASRAITPTVARFVGDTEAPQAITRVGLKCSINPKYDAVLQRSTTLTIIGNETGGRIVIPIVVSAAIPGTAAGTNNTAS